MSSEEVNRDEIEDINLTFYLSFSVNCQLQTVSKAHLHPVQNLSCPSYATVPVQTFILVIVLPLQPRLGHSNSPTDDRYQPPLYTKLSNPLYTKLSIINMIYPFSWHFAVQKHVMPP